MDQLPGIEDDDDPIIDALLFLEDRLSALPEATAAAIAVYLLGKYTGKEPRREHIRHMLAILRDMRDG